MTNPQKYDGKTQQGKLLEREKVHLKIERLADTLDHLDGQSITNTCELLHGQPSPCKTPKGTW